MHHQCRDPGPTRRGPRQNLFDDLDSMRLEPQKGLQSSGADISVTEIETEALNHRRRAYLRGPLPLAELCAAARLSGKALAVWLLVQYRTRVTRKAEITLPTWLLGAAGIDRNAKARALRELERVGLVRVRRGTGQTPRVFLGGTRHD